MAKAKRRAAKKKTAAKKQRKTRAHGRRRIHPSLASCEDQLRHAFGTPGRIPGGTARGRIEISYFSEEDLERILEVVGLVPGHEAGGETRV